MQILLWIWVITLLCSLDIRRRGYRNYIFLVCDVNDCSRILRQYNNIMMLNYWIKHICVFVNYRDYFNRWRECIHFLKLCVHMFGQQLDYHLGFYTIPRCCMMVNIHGELFIFLSHWGKMADLSQKTFSKPFSSLKIYEFRLRFHWSLFPKGQIDSISALVQIMAWRRTRRQAITWTNGGKFSDGYMRHSASMGKFICRMS